MTHDRRTDLHKRVIKECDSCGTRSVIRRDNEWWCFVCCQTKEGE